LTFSGFFLLHASVGFADRMYPPNWMYATRYFEILKAEEDLASSFVITVIAARGGMDEPLCVFFP